MSNDILLHLSDLEGRYPDRRDGRPRRTKVLAQKLRGTFIEVLDDDRTKVMVYITPEGTVRRDVAKVQEELARAGVYDGIVDDNEEVDVAEVLEDDEDFEEEDTDGEEEEPDEDDLDAISDDLDPEADEDYTPDQAEDEEDEEEEEEDPEADYPAVKRRRVQETQSQETPPSKE